MAAKQARNAQIAGFALVGAGVIGAGVLLAKGLGSVFSGLNDALKGLGSVASGAGNVADQAGQTIDLAGEFLHPGIIPGGGLNQDPANYSAEHGDLRILVYGKADRNFWQGIIRVKRTSVERLRVVDRKTGAGVPYATITGQFQFGPTNKVFGVQTWVADSDGWVTGKEWTVANVAGTDKEDDLVLVATAPGYNPSPAVELK